PKSATQFLCVFYRVAKGPVYHEGWREGGGSVHPQVLLHDGQHFLGGGEFHRHAILEMPDDAGAHAPQRDRGAHGRADVELDGGARQGNVDDLAIIAATIVEHDGGMADIGYDALMAPVLGQVEKILVGQPGELGGHLVALAGGGGDIHDEAAVDLCEDGALDATQMIEIGDDALAHDPRH